MRRGFRHVLFAVALCGLPTACASLLESGGGEMAAFASPDAVAAAERIPTPSPRPEPPRAIPVQQCEGATILARRGSGGPVREYFAMVDHGAFDAMIEQGCVQLRRGCNTCSVRYLDCSVEARLCADGDCMARLCERKTLCTAKFCTVESEGIPGCDSRMAQLSCDLTLFPTGAGDTPVVKPRSGGAIGLD